MNFFLYLVDDDELISEELKSMCELSKIRQSTNKMLLAWEHWLSSWVNEVRNLPATFKGSNMRWNLIVDSEAKWNLIQDRSCIWTLLEEVKDSDLKDCSEVFSDAVN